MTTGKRLLWFVAPLVLAAVLLGGAWLWLAGYTRHGQTEKVPNLRTHSFAEASASLEKLGLHAEVIDSVYSDEAPKGTVVSQDPDSGRFVKRDRTVYLVMNAMQPKMLNMPNLVNLSKRQAISVLDIIGLKVAGMEYRPDPCMDCVVAQLYKGQAIAADARIRKGEAITLVLGKGQEGEQVPVPDVRGLGFEEMKAVLNMASLNLGLVVEVQGCNTGCDTALAKVARQSPTPGPDVLISPGGLVDVWLTMDTTTVTP